MLKSRSHNRLYAYRLPSWETIGYVVLIALLVVTRLWDLGSRGYSHDEATHAWESWKLLTGQGYYHSPAFHGPFLYHFTALIFALLGDSDSTARLGAALFGIALAILPLALKPWLGRRGVLATLFLMTISPVMMCRSRFLRHDPFAAFFNLLLFIGLLRYLEHRQRRDLSLITVALALSFCTKETSFITLFLFGTFLVGYLGWRHWRRQPLTSIVRDPAFDLIVLLATLILPLAAPLLLKLVGVDPLDASSAGILHGTAATIGLLLIAAAIGLRWNPHWSRYAAIFWAIILTLHTTLFTNLDGLGSGTVGQLGYWLAQQKVARGGQPWYYYLFLLGLYEFLPLILALGGIAAYLWRRGYRHKNVDDNVHPRQLLVPWLIWWFVGGLAAYSWAGEKMPWLAMHLTVPLHLLAGWVLGRFIQAIGNELYRWRELALIPLLLLLGYIGVRWATLVLRRNGPLSQWDVALRGGLLMVGLAVLGIYFALGRHLSWRAHSYLWLSSLLTLLSALTIRYAWMASFINDDLATEYLVYAHGTPDTALVAHEVEALSLRLTGGHHLQVAYDDASQSPFYWYFRNYENEHFYGDSPDGPFEDEVVIVGPENEAAVRPLLGNRYVRRDYRLIWFPHQEWYMDNTLGQFLRDWRDPVKRKQHWNILFYRKHPRSPANWYHVETFALYLRRDLARQVWSLGEFEAPLEEEDLYVTRWQPKRADLAFPTDISLQISPRDVARDTDGYLYITDASGQRVVVLDPRGMLVRTWGSKGSEPGQFNEPWGIAISPTGEVWVADTWNHRIQVFDSQGHLLRFWGQPGAVSSPNGNGKLLYGPREIAFDPQGHACITDTGNKRVLCYDAEGQVILAVGGEGDGPGQFREPVGLAIDSRGNLYVADTWNQRIQVLSSDGRFIRAWPIAAWEGESVVNKPYLALDHTGHVYVTDPEGCRVLVFDASGELQLAWGRPGSDLDGLSLPTGIQVASDGRVLVADAGNGRVLLYTSPWLP